MTNVQIERSTMIFESVAPLFISHGAIALDFDGTHVVTGAGRGNYYCGKARVYEASAALAQ